MSRVLAQGHLRKMDAALAVPVQYQMVLDGQHTPLNELLGQSLQLDYSGQIACIYCGRNTSKSFNQGYCYPCFKRLAQCDSCIVSPEKCHFHLGTCREPQWGESHCLIDHYVYLANTSGIKVGITRHTQLPTRWLDQGATQAQPVFRVGSRYLSGLVETLFKAHIADRTNWQAMLRGPGEVVNLEAQRRELVAACAGDLARLRAEHGEGAIVELAGEAQTLIEYPVLSYPTKVTSFNLDKTPTIAGTLLGIKGQYLIFDSGVINLRKYGGHHVSLSRH
ncbi:MAG: DUF2797 domain-containing protein [Parahaliea sp.]